MMMNNSRHKANATGAIEFGYAPVISVVIPAYNEDKGIAAAVKHIAEILRSRETSWEIIVVDDGSRDQTYARICDLAHSDPRIKCLSFSRNFGKEAALLAGLKSSLGQAVITLDADLQHPPALIEEMLEKWRAGAQIVHAVKRVRKDDSASKKIAAFCVNRLISRLGGINVHNSSDFKLLDRTIVDIIVDQFPERQRFFRGLAGWLGFIEEYVYFDVPSRLDGRSKWSFWALVELSVTALTSFTSLPLRLVTFLGVATLLLGVLVSGEALWSWHNGLAVSGFTTTIISLLLIGSFIMISLGIIGEYIAKIYEEIKARPHYLIKSSIGLDNEALSGSKASRANSILYFPVYPAVANADRYPEKG